MANRRALDSAGLDRVSELISAGEPMTTVAADLHVSYKTIQNAVAELGLTVEKRRPRPVYPDALAAEAVVRYTAGESTGEIAKALRTSETWVRGRVAAASVQPRITAKLHGKDDEIRARYEAGESSMDIARSLGTSDVAVLARLRQAGVKLRSAGWATRKHPIRHDAFADADDPATAYWTGFLLADGSVATNGRVTLGLKASDEEHIQKWLTFLGSSETPIRPDESKVRAQVSSRRIAADLARHGVVPVKTTADQPTSDVMACSAAFWRGMVDGDGSIALPAGKHGPILQLVGSESVMIQFASFLGDRIHGTAPHVLKVSGTQVIRQVKVEGVRAREAIALLWSDVPLEESTNGPPALARKLARARAALEWRTRTEARLGAVARALGEDQ